MIYGIDIGGTKIETAVFDQQLNKLASWRVSTPTADYDLFIKTIAQQVLLADKTYQTTGKVGVGMPGLIDRNQHSLSANIPCANGKNVRESLGNLLNRPVAIENDCRCFALSEATGEAAGASYKRVYGAIIGTGAAGGLCINGQLDIGNNGIMGEYGHTSLPSFLQTKYNLKTMPCGCGLIGCMEYYIAGPGITKLYKIMFNKDITPVEATQLQAQGDSEAQKVLDCYLDLLGYTFSTIIHNHDPDIIVIGGGVSKIQYVMDTLPSRIAPYVFKGVKIPPIVCATFGDASGGRGAAILAAKG
jgi:N-acetylglucosamine kinase